MEVNGIELRSRGGQVGQLLFTDEAWDGIAMSLALSPRELEVVRQVFDDRKESRIARELGISPHTVHTYLERIYQKLNVTSRVQLVVRVAGQQNALMTDRAAGKSRRKSTPSRAHLRRSLHRVP